jgi:hypothetical protein
VLGAHEDLPQTQARLAHALFLLGDEERSAALLDEAERMADEVGMAESLATVLMERGEQARLRGELERAEEFLLRARDQIGPFVVAPQFSAMIGSSLGHLATQRGDLVAARALHLEALENSITSADAPFIGLALVGLADLSLHEGAPALAATLLGAATGVRGAQDLSVSELPSVEQAAQDALGEIAFAEAYQRGLSMTTVDQIRTLMDLV